MAKSRPDLLSDVISSCSLNGCASADGLQNTLLLLYLHVDQADVCPAQTGEGEDKRDGTFCRATFHFHLRFPLENTV